MAETLTPKEHIEAIRKTKFSIGGEANPLTEDLHQSVKNLSAELYAKDVHFLMEIIQNAEDNVYPEGVKPSLEFLVTSRDITGTGAPSTLIIFNNEKGFSAKNIESICSVGRSTKKGQRQQGYIGEKGIGFKSVFLITAQPYIFSNGYQIKFGEEPCPHCRLGYIVPVWVEHKPSIQDIEKLYGSGAPLPATTIILPLKPEKEKVVKIQLSSIHPELLLFLSKIRRLSVREDNEDSKHNTVNAISISSERDFVTRKNVGAESYTLILSADESSHDHKRECSYYMWRQKFPVNEAKRVERRMEVDELVITLAFPNGERLHRGNKSPGIYAFLPTEMVTNFPFVIQADFVLASSRETILLDNKWNQGILDCVPSAFVNAFMSLLKTSEAAPASSLSHMFQFLPVDSSSYLELNVVQDSIKDKLLKENIMPSELSTGQRFFHKPNEVGKILSDFWSILVKAKNQGICLDNIWTISSDGQYALNSAFDHKCYDGILKFLGVRSMHSEWYSKCIQSSNNLVLGLSEDVYLALLYFVAAKWSSHFQSTTMKNVLLLKYVGQDGSLHLCSVNEANNWVQRRIYLSKDFRHTTWLINWNREFNCAAGFFMPKSTMESLQSYCNSQTVTTWLSRHAKANYVSVNEYAVLLKESLNSDRRLVVSFAHFLCQSLSMKGVSHDEIRSLCKNMPLVNKYGSVVRRSGGVLVPANGSKWVELIGPNPWSEKNYVELGEDYLRGGNYAGVFTSTAELMTFLKDQIEASDIPDLFPPDDVFSAISSPLTKKNAFLLLEWIRNLKSKRKLSNGKFLKCIKEGCWLRTTVGVRPPCQSFLVTSSWGNLLNNGSELVEIPFIDQQFYDNRIVGYKEELVELGVMSDLGEALQFIGKHLMLLSSNRNLTKANVFSILRFIKFLREKSLPPVEFINSIRQGLLLRTAHGEKSPVGAILCDTDWTAASRICDLPFVDQKYYGDEILSFRTELQLLGVAVSFDRDYQRLTDCFRMPSPCTSLTEGDIVLILECIRHARSSDKLVGLLKNQRWLNTNLGFRSPSECFLFDYEWGCLLQIFSGFPLVDDKSYGTNFFTFKDELRKLGVAVGFEDALKAFICEFKQKASHSITQENVFSLLKCYRKLKKTTTLFSGDFRKCICDENWLKTRLGQKPPRESILFSPDWEDISKISLLPFIGDSQCCYGAAIQEYQEELKDIGVVTEFNKGSKFVASGLSLPQNLADVTPASVLSLLQCIHNILKEPNESLIKDFMARLNKRWLKTSMGYRSPNECFLFSSHWKSLLQCEDAAFLDEKFYGFDLCVYRKELNAIGVTVDIENGCDLLASQLEYHSRFDAISRIYVYLDKYDWKPKNKDAKWIWIPSGSNNGQWVSPEECVLSDKDCLFNLRLKVLENHYERKLLTFFSMSLGVRHNPSIDDYCRLWKTWEVSGCQLTPTECCAFWGYLVRHWNSKTKDYLAEIVKVPSIATTGSKVIQMVNKQDAFLPDDLLLMDLFEKASPNPVSVWYPQPSIANMPRTKLFEIYSSIGVRPISKAVQKIELFAIDGEYKQVDSRELLIQEELIKVILGFLSDPSVDMDSNKRQITVKPLVDVSVYETGEPISIKYSLPLSSGVNVDVMARQMIRWERGSSKMFFQKIERSNCHKANLEFAIHFSKAVAEGLLWEKEDQISELSELIKLGWLLEFDEEAIAFLLKTKNLQVFLEDVEFLKSLFSSE